MIKLVKVEEEVNLNTGSDKALILNFITSKMPQARLDLADEPRAPQVVYSNLYQIIRKDDTFRVKVKITMRNSEIYLVRLDQ